MEKIYVRTLEMQHLIGRQYCKIYYVSMDCNPWKALEIRQEAKKRRVILIRISNQEFDEKSKGGAE